MVPEIALQRIYNLVPTLDIEHFDFNVHVCIFLFSARPTPCIYITRGSSFCVRIVFARWNKTSLVIIGLVHDFNWWCTFLLISRWRFHPDFSKQ